MVDIRLFAVGVVGADGDDRVPNNAAKDKGPVPKALELVAPPPPAVSPIPIFMPHAYGGDGLGA